MTNISYDTISPSNCLVQLEFGLLPKIYDFYIFDHDVFKSLFISNLNNLTQIAFEFKK